MHIEKIEEFSFTHGKHINNLTGEYHSLNPHDLGRPLTHTEMDYNLLYQKQTINGYRIVGTNTDLTLSTDDLGKVLSFHKFGTTVLTTPERNILLAAGIFDNQLIWYPSELTAATTTTTSTTTTTTTTLAPPQYTGLTSNVASVNEGGTIIWTVASTNVIPGTTISYVLAGTATEGQDYPIQSGTLTINSDTQIFTIPTIADNTTEGTELVTLTLGATDSAGTACGLDQGVVINDTSLDPLVPEYTYLTISDDPVNIFQVNSVSEGYGLDGTGQTLFVRLQGTNIADNTTVPFTITGIQSSDIDIPLTGVFTMMSGFSDIQFGIEEDADFTEVVETMTIDLLLVQDSVGTEVGLTASMDIHDQVTTTTSTTTTTTSTTTTTLAPTTTTTTTLAPAQYRFIATATDNIVNGWESPAASGNSTGVINGSWVNAGLNSSGHCYAVPAMGYTYTDQNQVLMAPDQLTLTPSVYNSNHDGTITSNQFSSPQGSWRWGVKFILNANNIQQMEYANISLTDANGGAQRMYQSLTGPSTWAEDGSTGLVTLNTVGISDAFIAGNPYSTGAYQPNGVTCGFTITGSATGGGVDYGSGGIINPVPLTADAVGIDFSAIVADLITEGSETVTITLDDFDSIGNPTFGLSKTITISDDSQTPDEIHWLHWSSNPGRPTGSSLIVQPTNGWLLNDSSYTTDFDLVWADMVTYQGTANNVPVIETASISGGLTQSSIPNGTIGFNSIGAANRYYIAIPQSITGDPSSTALFQLPDSSNADITFSGRMAFTLSGIDYWLYDVGLTASVDALNLNLKNA